MRRLRRILPTTVLVASLLTLGPSASAQSQSCSEQPEFSQLDFWVGTWEVFDADGEKSADVTVEKALDGCALYEEWDGYDGGSDGLGLATYDRRIDEWRYFWVADSGYMSVWTGELMENEMRFVRRQAEPDGGTRLRHWSLIALPDGRVRELSRASLDGGESWEVEYDLYWEETSEN